MASQSEVGPENGNPLLRHLTLTLFDWAPPSAGIQAQTGAWRPGLHVVKRKVGCPLGLCDKKPNPEAPNNKPPIALNFPVTKQK